MAINRPNNRFFNRAFRLQASTPPAIEHLSFASPDSCTESTAEHFSLEQAMIQQQAMMKDALSPHTPASPHYAAPNSISAFIAPKTEIRCLVVDVAASGG